MTETLVWWQLYQLPGKGGKFFQYFVTELTRFVVSTGYREVRMRCDSEPATHAILESTIKTCRILGIQVTAEPTAVGNHEANGGAERTVELVRSHANILVTHLESCCGADRQVFGCDHPIYSMGPFSQCMAEQSIQGESRPNTI